jgi:hypothetical protein
MRDGASGLLLNVFAPTPLSPDVGGTMREPAPKSSKKAIVGMLAVVGITLCFAWLFFVPRGGGRIVREYRAQGFQMVDGCNGGAANGARAEVYMLQQRLEDFADSPEADTNKIIQLKSVLAVAQEKERILREDCARRGHCETYPWKTNWVRIKDALTASEELYPRETNYGATNGLSQ